MHNLLIRNKNKNKLIKCTIPYALLPGMLTTGPAGVHTDHRL